MPGLRFDESKGKRCAVVDFPIDQAELPAGSALGEAALERSTTTTKDLWF
jgi:hypothetical protein